MANFDNINLVLEKYLREFNYRPGTPYYNEQKETIIVGFYNDFDNLEISGRIIVHPKAMSVRKRYIWKKTNEEIEYIDIIKLDANRIYGNIWGLIGYELENVVFEDKGIILKEGIKPFKEDGYLEKVDEVFSVMNNNTESIQRKKILN